MGYLEMRNVSKSYGKGRQKTEVLSNINMSLEKGEFVALVGYSGVGKTTFMSLLAGLITPDSGEILLEGKPITGPDSSRALVFQNYSLLPWFTVYDNIALATSQVLGKSDSKTKRHYTEKYITMVNLTPARDKFPNELSGGMRQRVSVARALALNPSVLLLDEPLSALDALTRATLQDEIIKIWGQDRKTVVLITNDVDEGIMLADRIIPMSKGPNATLGPSIPVHLSRPRDRRLLNHSEEFKHIRKQVLDYLLSQGQSTVHKTQVSTVRGTLTPQNSRLVPNKGQKKITQETFDALRDFSSKGAA